MNPAGRPRVPPPHPLNVLAHIRMHISISGLVSRDFVPDDKEVILRTAAGILAPLTAAGLLAGVLVGLAAPVASAAVVQVSATVETAPIHGSGDAADDPAIWIHPTDPATTKWPPGPSRQLFRDDNFDDKRRGHREVFRRFRA